MLALLTASLALAQYPLNFPAGYYTLSELASKLTEQGVPAVANQGCAGDVYAVRLDKGSWPALMTALTRDGRLYIEQEHGKWAIALDPDNRSAEQAALKKYMAVAAAKIHEIYEPVRLTCMDYAAVPVSKRQTVAPRQSTSKDPKVQEQVEQLTYLAAEAEDIPFGSISTAAALTDPKGPPALGKLKLTTMLDSPTLFFASGDIREIANIGRALPYDFRSFTDQDWINFARTVQLGYKMAVDPLTLATTCWTLGSFRIGELNGSVTLAEYVSPKRIALNVGLPSIWDNVAIEKMRARSNNPGGVADREVNLPGPPLRVSEALLKVAEGGKFNLVSYVSPFSDVMLQPKQRGSVSQVIDEINHDRIEGAWTKLVLTEHVGPDMPTALSPALQSRFRMSSWIGSGVVSVRNEMRFLDWLCVSPAAAPTAIDNGTMRNETPDYRALLDAVAALKPSSWASSFVSSNYLHYCNPVSLRPFALALLRSKKLSDGLKIANSRPQVFSLAQLEPEARQAFTQGVYDCAKFNDVTASARHHPLMAEVALRRPQPEAPTIELTRKGNVWSFVLKQNASELWTSWMTGVTVPP